MLRFMLSMLSDQFTPTMLARLTILSLAFCTDRSKKGSKPNRTSIALPVNRRPNVGLGVA